MLPVRDKSSIDQCHHVVDTRLIVDYQIDVRGGSFKDLDCRVELRSPSRLLGSRDRAVAV
eukprot:6597270-Heterocapsa_arctica.AAC.1